MTKAAIVSRLTGPQRRAIEMLPADGSWTTMFHGISAALNSLVLRHPTLAETEWGDFGPRGGKMRRARLTKTGVKVRTALT